jgi:cell shape-determining protein MreC
VIGLMDIEPLQFTDWLTTPRGFLGVGLILAVLLILLPPAWFTPVRGVVGAGLLPCQIGIANLLTEKDRLADEAKRHFDTVAQLTEAERNLDRLRSENDRLSAQLEEFETRQSDLERESVSDAEDRLLTLQCIWARVLGQQARAFLQQNLPLDVGSRAGVQSDALVIASPEGLLIDRGRAAELQSGQFVLSRGQVWGKIVEVGPYTSTVRTVTEPGYRDLIRLATPDAEGRPTRWGPEGILEGSGERLARIRLVEVTEPVSVGDLVFTAAGKGVLPKPLLYGRVVRVERPTGASHWDIWMESALGEHGPRRVAVLRIQLNPSRVAERSSE